MTGQWPQFITRDLGESDADDAERDRRWELYNREMQALIASGSVRQDEDGWWIDIATGELVGPDPELERPLSDAELAAMRPLVEVDPDLAQRLVQAGGASGFTSEGTLRLDPEVLERLQASGPDWQRRANNVLKKALGL